MQHAAHHAWLTTTCNNLCGPHPCPVKPGRHHCGRVRGSIQHKSWGYSQTPCSGLLAHSSGLATLQPGDLDEEEEADNGEEGSDPGMTAVCRLTAVRDAPRLDMPLLLGAVKSVARSATVISYREQTWILTTASSVVYASQGLRVHVPGHKRPFKATIAHLALEADLAVLALTGPGGGVRRRLLPSRSRVTSAEGEGSRADFDEAVDPLSLGGLPRLQDKVQVLGLTAGAAKPVAATGRVACIEAMTYPIGSYRLLGLQLTCSIPKGRLGGPVIDGAGRCIGLSYKRTVGARSAGGRGEDQVCAVPASVITHVLDDIIEHGRYQGFPQLGVRYKRLDSPALRKSLGMGMSTMGVYVLDINPTSPSASTLQRGDVLLTLAGQQVGEDGTVPFPGGGRVAVTHAVAKLAVGTTTDVTVLRGGQELQLRMRLGVPHRLVAAHLGGAPPSYLVIGGLLLTVVTISFMEQVWGPGWARAAPPRLVALLTQHPEDSTQQVVVVAHVQPCSTTEGYDSQDVQHQVVSHFRVGKSAGAPGPAAAQLHPLDHNSSQDPHLTDPSAPGDARSATSSMQRVHNLRQLAAAIMACGRDRLEGEIRLELADGVVIVMGVAQAAADSRELLAEFEVASPVSEDLLDLTASGLSVGGHRGSVGGRKGPRS